MEFSITWPLAVTVISGLAVAAGAAIKIFRKEKSPTLKKAEDDVNKLNSRASVLESNIDALKDDVNNLKQEVKDDNETCRRSFEKLEKKIEKVSDLIIELIRTHNS